MLANEPLSFYQQPYLFAQRCAMNEQKSPCANQLDGTFPPKCCTNARKSWRDGDRCLAAKEESVDSRLVMGKDLDH